MDIPSVQKCKEDGLHVREQGRRTTVQVDLGWGMIDLKGRVIDEYGNTAFNMEGVIDLLMKGGEIAGIQVLDDPVFSNFNQLCKEFDHPEDQVTFYEPPAVSVADWDCERQARWFIPEPFAKLNVLDWLVERCSTEEQGIRILEEWKLFEEKGMENVLRFMIYMVDHLRSNGILWGVGRGSSVASYVLYLIGVHRIDSMRFGLDYREFLK